MVSPAAFTLVAASDTLVVDVEAGERFAVTQVSYTREPDWVILHRLNNDDWVKVAVPSTGPNDPALVKGSFTTLPIKPGSCYQACIVPADFRAPAQPAPYEWRVSYGESEEPPAHMSVVALRKAPEEREFYSDGNSRTFGTFHERDVVTLRPVRAILSIGREPPRDLGDGRLSLPSPAATHVRGPGESFGFQIPGLTPGTEYHTVLLLVDELGNWQVLTERVTTLRRKVELVPQALFIVDDGDDFSNGEGDFTFYVSAGGDVARSNSIDYGNSNLETGQFVAPPPSGNLVLGPYTPISHRPSVHLTVIGRQDNTGSLEGSDQAIGAVEIACPSGPGETVTSLPGAIQLGSDGFEFRLDYRYSVSYL